MKLLRHACPIVVALVGFAGCQQAVDPAVRKEREKYLLSEEPTGAVSVSQARKQVTQQQPIVLRGRVGAGEHLTWEPGKAAFVVRDPAAPLYPHHVAAGHDPDNCPFCKGDKGSTPDMTALIRVVDDSGAVVDIDARKLLPIREEQLVVVQGMAQVDPLGNLVIAANGVYVPR